MVRRAVLASLAAVLGLLPIAAAASVDLKSLLADPPSSDWLESEPTPTILDGPFTAESYGAYQQAIDTTGSTHTSTVAKLHRYGFAAGYARSWEQRDTQDDLDERVFEFADSAGAGYWYADLKRESQTGTEYLADIPGTSTVPDSFGVVLKGNGYREYRVEFKKGNLMVVVHVDADTNDQSSLAIAQAIKIEALSPAASATPVSPIPPAVGRVFGGIIVAIALLAGAGVVIGAILYLASQRRRTASALAAGVHMSPDWSYWWDGAQWQPAATTVPPAAQRSPDGAHWWDGRSWRPISAPERPPVLL